MFDKELSLQEYFYIGYLYLIALGIVSDAIFYAVLNVSYLNYITILDALISPISLLSNNWIMTLVLIGLFALMYFHITKFSPWLYKKWRNKKWYQKFTNIERADKRYEAIKEKKNIISGMMFLFFFLFLSMRIGMAIGTKNKLTTKEIKPNYELIFKDNSKVDVLKIGQNSAYFFYVIPGEKVVTITPILDNLKQIKRVKKLDE